MERVEKARKLTGRRGAGEAIAAQGARPRGLGPVHDLHGRLENQFTPAVKADLKRGFSVLRDDIPLTEFEKAMSLGTPERVMRSIDYRDRLAALLDGPFDKVMDAGERAFRGAVRLMPDRVRLFYDQVPAADGVMRRLENFAADRKGDIIKTTEEGMHEAVRVELQRATQKRLSPREMAANVRDSIGLNARQAVALSNYRNALSAPQVDPDTRKPLPGLSMRRQTELVADYQERLIDARADMIARSELRFAANAAQQQTWEAAIENDLLPPNAKKRWVIDGKPCKELCLPMSNPSRGIVPITDPWILPDGRAVMTPTESHPNCMCVAVAVF
jgi:hypothetical protein